MSTYRILPQFFSSENSWKNHWEGDFCWNHKFFMLKAGKLIFRQMMVFAEKVNWVHVVYRQIRIFTQLHFKQFEEISCQIHHSVHDRLQFLSSQDWYIYYHRSAGHLACTRCLTMPVFIQELCLSRMKIDKKMNQRLTINFMWILEQLSQEIHEMWMAVNEVNNLKHG